MFKYVTMKKSINLIKRPLINASRRGYMDIVEYLVENGADVNLGVEARTRAGVGTEFRTPLNMAKNAKISDYLKSKGATK